MTENSSQIAPPSSIGSLLHTLWLHLSRRRRRHFFLLSGLMLLSSLADVISLGTVLPFLGVLTAPEHVLQYPIVRDLSKVWNISSPQQLILPASISFGIAAVMAAIVRMLLVWSSTRLAFATGAELSIEAYRRTLCQPYQIHAARNTSNVISGIVNKVGAVVHGVLVPFPNLVSSIVVLVMLTIALVAINPMVAVAAFGGFGVAYGTIAVLYRRRLRTNSDRIAREQAQVIKVLQEGLGAIRDVLLDGTQAIYCNTFHRADLSLKQAQADLVFIGTSPRYLMEAVGIIIIAAIAYHAVVVDGTVLLVLPTLGALALGAQRMLPALQQSYGSWVSIAGSYASIRDTIELLEQPVDEGMAHEDIPALSVEHSISFDSVGFRYDGTSRWVLRDVSFVVAKGMRVGIVGRTGSGKSTMLDLLMALLSPVDGYVRIDGAPLIGVRIPAWQKTIAHVPQAVFLADASITENIALGIEAKAIDMQRVREAARQAQIADFIEDLPDGYATLTGERGVRLSGGQRQRIGIARALYRRADVLIFDEATSALDTATEQAVMSTLADLDHKLTIFIIAHRLSTVRHCDKIIELEQGQLVGEGTYEELYRASPSFREMASAADKGAAS